MPVLSAPDDAATEAAAPAIAMPVLMAAAAVALAVDAAIRVICVVRAPVAVATAVEAAEILLGVAAAADGNIPLRGRAKSCQGLAVRLAIAASVGQVENEPLPPKDNTPKVLAPLANIFVENPLCAVDVVSAEIFTPSTHIACLPAVRLFIYPRVCAPLASAGTVIVAFPLNVTVTVPSAFKVAVPSLVPEPLFSDLTSSPVAPRTK